MEFIMISTAALLAFYASEYSRMLMRACIKRTVHVGVPGRLSERQKFSAVFEMDFKQQPLSFAPAKLLRFN